MEVTAHVTREEGLSGKWWWVTEIEPGGGATQARRLDQPAAGVREVVILRDDLDDDTDIAVNLDYSALPELDADLTAIRVAKETETEARAAINERIARLVAPSIDEGWTAGERR
jgi:hypothetical protein